jgi:formylglycine-generating enzyme required for sulfatase activity
MLKNGPSGVPGEGPSEDAKTIILDYASRSGEASASAADRLLERGITLLGRFKLLERIGQGGMSRVYKAVDLRLVEAGSDDPHVAVKVLTMPFANYSDAMQILAREAHSLRSATHPNIVRVIDCDRDGDIVFMTLELLSGQSLFDKLRRVQPRGLSRAHALGIIKGIADALEFAHGKNIVHGDLKPGNVIITDRNEVKVIDFGLARLTTLPETVRTRRASKSGNDLRALTPAYASPQRLEKGPPDPRDDVFALGCIAWMLLTGEHPFKGKSLTAHDEATELRHPSELTRKQFHALRHALAFERDKRTPSAQQLFAELSGASSGRSWRLAAGIGALVLASLGVAGYVAFKSRSKPVVAMAVAVTKVASAPATLTPGEVFRDCPACPLMKVLPRGEFMQGSAASDADTQRFELPQHKVSIREPFTMGVYDVTVNEYSQFVADSGYGIIGCALYAGIWRTSGEVSWKNAVAAQTPQHPVTCVSWQDARQFALWLSQRTGHTYRLPSASEWEYAARAGSTASRPWSDPSQACTYANLADQTAAQRYPGWRVQPCADHFVQSAPVGSFSANAFGLYDTLGNVFQWVSDCWADDYQDAPSDGSARADGDCAQRELRGGSWFSRPDYVRVSYRNRFPTDYRSNTVGFRLLREITP